MLAFLRHRLWPAIALLGVMTLITGFAYPGVVTALGQLAFPDQANGSFITPADGQRVGSSLVGQAFSEPGYLWGRPSAAGADGYDANASAGSNLGPTSQALLDRITAEVERLRSIHGDAPIPVELLTTSASGFDPHISPAAAEYQVARIADARSLAADDLRAVISRNTEQPLIGFMGQPRVNVLRVNLELDALLQ